MEQLLHKSIIVSLLCVAFVTFILGRETAPSLPAEIIEKKIVDTEAVTKAVELERKKILSQFAQKKVRDYVKLPNGEIRVHETVETQRAQKEVAETSKKESVDTKSHETSQTIFKVPQNDYSVEALIGKDKFDLSRENLIYGVNVSRRIVGNTWIGVWGNSERQFGVSLRYEW